MSAPDGVWIPFSPDGEMVGLAEERNECGDAVRYLRADLTCGECGIFHNAMHKCRHNNVNDGDAPACMAFTRRKP